MSTTTTTTSSGGTVYNTITYNEKIETDKLSHEFVFEIYVFINAILFITTFIVFIIKISKLKGVKKVFNNKYIFTGRN